MREVLKAIVTALLIVTFVAQAFWIPSESMAHTLEPGDRVIAWKLFYKPSRGDVVVFVSPDRTTHLVKRIVGLPGDTVELRAGKLYLNGELQPEPYAQTVERSAFGPITVPNDKIFVLGDNRDNSRDSRFFGAVPIDDVVGKATIIYWSSTWSRIGKTA